jgi:hypothetical protein
MFPKKMFDTTSIKNKKVEAKNHKSRNKHALTHYISYYIEMIH